MEYVLVLHATDLQNIWYTEYYFEWYLNTDKLYA